MIVSSTLVSSLGGSKRAKFVVGGIFLIEESSRVDQNLGTIIRYLGVEREIVRDAKSEEDICYFFYDAEIWRDNKYLYTNLGKTVVLPANSKARKILSVYSAEKGSQKFSPTSYLELRPAGGEKIKKGTPPQGDFSYHHKTKLKFRPVLHTDAPQRFVFSFRQRFLPREPLDQIIPIVHHDRVNSFKIGVNAFGAK